MARGPLCAVIALLTLLVPQAAGAAARGEERVLIILATSGAKPYTRAEVETTAREAATFFQKSSLGQLRLTTEVTPWISAYSANPGCGSFNNRSLSDVVDPARRAADAAGYNPSSYDDVVYAIADNRCGFHGATWGHEVMLTRQPTVELLVHELGHALGLGHAQTSACKVAPSHCGVDENGDPFSPMGRGLLDFSAYEKVLLGWIPAQARVNVAKRYVLAPPTGRSKLAQALVIEMEEGTWWIEYRAVPFRGLLVRFVENRDLPPFARSAALMSRPVKAGRPWIAKGESYRLPGSFRLTLLKASATRGELRLR